MSEFPRQLDGGPLGEVWEYAPDRLLFAIHPRGQCRGPHCVLHSPSDHHMRDWPLHWRWADGLVSLNEGFERICPHGIGHPDPDCTSINDVHGCDGCCHPDERTRDAIDDAISATIEQITEGAR